jgi:hypothetical protein
LGPASLQGTEGSHEKKGPKCSLEVKRSHRVRGLGVVYRSSEVF